ENKGLDLGAGSDLSNRIPSRQRILHDPAEMIILDFRAAHVAAMDQHIGALSKAIYAVTRNRIATYRDDLTFGLKSVPVTLPSLPKCQRQVEPITMINSIGGYLPTHFVSNSTRRHNTAE